MSELSVRVARLEARSELGDLVAAYFHLVDGGEIPSLVRLFTPEGAFQHPGGTVTGSDDLEVFYTEQLARWPSTYHYPHSHVVLLEGDGTASGTVEAHAEHASDGTCVLAALRYEDEYRRAGGVWRFARRQLHMR